MDENPACRASSTRLTAILAVPVLALLLVAPCSNGAEAGQPTAQKAVLVTGAGSGIGRKITERLASEGYFVYAGVRKDADLQKLPAHKHIQGLRLDVTNHKDISAAVATVTKEGRGLYGLVNNAGVFSVASVADTKPEEFELMIAVNVYGPLRVTQAFLPLITAAKGRVVTIGSITGFFGAKNLSAYCMSKHAVEAFTDSLAAEMEPFGVKVSVIEPGGYKSNLLNASVERGAMDSQLAKQVNAKQHEEPDAVASAAMLSLFEENPKRRYLVVPNADQAHVAIRSQVVRLVQANEGQLYTYSRDELIALLDEALAHSTSATRREH